MATQLGVRADRLSGVRALKTVKERRERGRFAFEGATLLEEARRSGVAIERSRVAARGALRRTERDFDLAIVGDGAAGRPHVARALVAAGVVPDVPAAFVPEWIGNDGRAYVGKYSLDPARAIALVKAAGGVTVFAHPAASSRGAVVDEAAIEAFALAGLDGLEVDHPDHDAATRERLRAVASELGLLVTGSSDYHGSVKETQLAAFTTDPHVFEILAGRASGGQVFSR